MVWHNIILICIILFLLLKDCDKTKFLIKLDSLVFKFHTFLLDKINKIKKKDDENNK